MASNNPFPQPISEEIWERKYKLTTPNPEFPNDLSVQDTWGRIAKATAESPIQLYNEGSLCRVDWKNREALFNSALEDFKYLPAGRITAGAGSGRAVTLFNCYVMGEIGDDLNSIFSNLREAALTMQQGGGIGYDFSPIRPTGAPVKGVDADASGPLSFMDVWDAMCRTIMSAGARRGAMMATIRCDHPDLMDFIQAKHEKGRLNMFNMSVLATDDFMEAVNNDDDWPLCHEVAPKEPVEYTPRRATRENPFGKTVTEIDGRHVYEVVRAADLWDAIMENTYNHAEPGVLFVDRINKMNNLWYVETISSTNPCGEQPLPPYGACLLGSVNLARMVVRPFQGDAYIDFQEIKRIAAIAVRMTDAVIDISNFPLPEQQAEAKFKRRMGIGITGLADMLYMANMTYGSDQAADAAELVMKTITIEAYRESIRLAREFGPCPATETFDQRVLFLKSGFMSNPEFPSELQDEFMSYGIRNALLTSIAPTGTISMYAGNVSSGIEPIFAPSYMRKVLDDNGKDSRKQLVEDYAVLRHREYCESLGLDSEDERFTKHLVTAQTLTPEDHLVMQAAVQKWVDSSISKTINCPKEISFEDFKAVYLRAYELGLKGCTTYRPNDTLGSVLEIVEDEPKEDLEELDYVELTEIPEAQVVQTSSTLPAPRTPILDGQTYKLKWKKHNFYVTINNAMIDGKLSPFEIFINTQNMDNFQWITALTRMMSSVFRRGGDISFMVKDLKSIMDPNGGEFVAGKYQHSFISYLGRIVGEHLAFLDEGRIVVQPLPVNEPYVEPSQPGAESKCPECGEYAVVNNGGCPTCQDCGHSKCG